MLDVLDLHENRISGKIDFSQHLKKLQNLRILNLSGNQIDEVEITTPMKSLMELNLRGNKIKELKIGTGVKGLKEIVFENLTKIYLSNNQIKNFDHVVSCKLMLAKVGELTLENNPIERDSNIKKILEEKFPGLSPLTMQKIQNTSSCSPAPMRDKNVLDSSTLGTILSPRESSVEREREQSTTPTIVHAKGGLTAAKKKAQENQVIKIIQKEWEKETDRLDSKKNGQYAKNPNAKNLGDKSLV